MTDYSQCEDRSDSQFRSGLESHGCSIAILIHGFRCIFICISEGFLNRSGKITDFFSCFHAIIKVSNIKLASVYGFIHAIFICISICLVGLLGIDHSKAQKHNYKSSNFHLLLLVFYVILKYNYK